MWRRQCPSRRGRREAGAKLWRLEELAARYQPVLGQGHVLTAQAGQHAAGAAAFRAFAAATLPIYQVSADDPDLPADLLPPDWPGDELAAALGHAFRSFGPLTGDYLGGLAP